MGASVLFPHSTTSSARRVKVLKVFRQTSYSGGSWEGCGRLLRGYWEALGSGSADSVRLVLAGIGALRGTSRPWEFKHPTTPYIAPFG